MKKYRILIAVEIIIMLFLTVQSIGSGRNYIFHTGDFIVSSEKVQCEDDSYILYADDFAQGEDTQILRTNQISMKNGSYDVTVYYTCTGQAEPDTTLVKAMTGSYSNPSGVTGGTVKAMADYVSATNRIHVNSLMKINDVEVDLYFTGESDIAISAVEIKEIMAYRIIRLLKWLLAFLALDFGIWYFLLNEKITEQQKKITASLLLTIITASIPATMDSLNKTFDLQFHITRIWSLADEIGRGNYYPAIQSTMINGYGYVNPLMYGQLFLYIPAVLYRMGMFMQEAYHCYFWLVNGATCLVAYFSFKQLVKAKEAALVGAFLYVTAAYRIQNMYSRGALGEYTAQIFLPLVLYGFYHIYTQKAPYRFKDWILLVIGLTGMVQSHVLTVEMSAFFICVFVLVHIKDTLQKDRFLVLVKVVVAALLLNASFLVPFVTSMRMDMQVFNNDGRGIQGLAENFIKAIGLFYPEFCTDSSTIITEVFGLAVIIGGLLCLWCKANSSAWNITDTDELKAGVIYTIYGVIAFVISLSVFPWDSIYAFSSRLSGIVSAVQFPWRYMGIALVFLSAASVVGLDLYKRFRGNYHYFVIILLMISLVGIGYYYESMATRHAGAYEKVYGDSDIDKTYIANGEYLLNGTEVELCETAAVEAGENIQIISYTHKGEQIEIQCENHDGQAGLVTIPVFNYDNYHVYMMETKQELEIVNGNNNCISFNVPGDYQGMILVQYERPIIWHISYAVSVITVLGLILFYMREKKNS